MGLPPSSEVPRKRTSLWVVSVVTLGTALVLLTATVATCVLDSGRWKYEPIRTREEAEARLMLRLPADTQILHGQLVSSGMHGWGAYVKATMPVHELREFAHGSNFAGKVFTGRSAVDYYLADPP